jgi:hypothetical protein
MANQLPGVESRSVWVLRRTIGRDHGKRSSRHRLADMVSCCRSGLVQ